ncbi:glycoside hydrolase family 76 protein [Bacteroides sp. 519]|uniref:glycoside hydrolase family 76 protein n=1 Tax=Bacteroides sp. 519 TaxID=2302937 RepID=UPI0013D3B1CB|nr:glycoside hydrolase family 76 protein [Bacteroides sp. 519]NDV58151.1 alpha-1,6-mannanase [Bacteroides sp. 519]
MQKKQLVTMLVAGVLFGCTTNNYETKEQEDDVGKARITMDSIYVHYAAPDTKLLRENCPFDDRYRATYLAAEESNLPNEYSYLWPYSGTFSAVNALYESTRDDRLKKILDKQVLVGLEEYFDTKRVPYGYASYIRTAPESDRFYDDNIWLGIDFTDIYTMSNEAHYLEKAKLIWDFVLSGKDNKLDGGIYWCEQKKESKNTCSNAPASVFAFKLFKATGDSVYFKTGQELYKWTQTHLQDESDKLYFDHIALDGKIGKAKYAYNSGQMMQAAALLYKLTQKQEYLTEAQDIAKACYSYFFHDFTTPNGDKFNMLNKGDTWFTAVMLRGFIELYRIDENKEYITAFKKTLDYAWDYARDDNGLFYTDFSGKKQEKKKWLLTQAAMVEMYARLATVEL